VAAYPIHTMTKDDILKSGMGFRESESGTGTLLILRFSNDQAEHWLILTQQVEGLPWMVNYLCKSRTPTHLANLLADTTRLCTLDELAGFIRDKTGNSLPCA
jgi:hypothetical protein